MRSGASGCRDRTACRRCTAPDTRATRRTPGTRARPTTHPARVPSPAFLPRPTDLDLPAPGVPSLLVDLGLEGPLGLGDGPLLGLALEEGEEGAGTGTALDPVGADEVHLGHHAGRLGADDVRVDNAPVLPLPHSLPRPP